MATIFDKILSGEIPCHKVWEDAEHLAFLDVHPRVPGHTLVVPKRPQDYLFDLDDAQLGKLWSAAKQVATKLKRSLPCERVCVMVIGWEVRHVHIHLLPTNAMSDIGMPPVDAGAVAGLAALGAKLAPR